MRTADVNVDAADLRSVRAELLGAGFGGVEFTTAYTDAVDEWLRSLFAGALDGQDESGVALLAVGGYGRRELCPASDLDVVLVHDKRRSVDKMAEALWYPVWDTGFHLDYSVRTPKEIMTMASRDLKVALGLLTARPVAGDLELGDTVAKAAGDEWAKRSRTSLANLYGAVQERWQTSGDLAFLLEPDLKQSKGGLRDLEALRAAARATPIAEPALEDAGVADAHDVLVRVRVAMHTVASRRGDTLVREDQDAIAETLGVADRDELMLAVSEAGRRVAWASDDTWDRIESSLNGPGRRGGRDLAVEPDVVLRDGEMAMDASASPALDDSLPFRVAAAAGRAGVPISRDTLRRLALQPPPLSTTRRWSTAAHHAFISLLGCGPVAVRHLETLDNIGVLVHYLPEWPTVRNRPQHSPTHTFTVDRHMLETAANAAGLVRRVHRPDLLLVAGLLHDIGKGQDGDHIEAGMQLVRVIAERMGFEPVDVETLVLLVRDHLLLPETATRRELHDPATLHMVAARVQTAERLELLSALSEADSLATGPSVWSAWKEELVAELVARTHDLLAGGRAWTAPPMELPTPAHRRVMAEGEVRLFSDGDSLTVIAPDRPGLLALLAGTFTLHRLPVLSAMAASEDGMAVDVFRLDTRYEDSPDWMRMEADIRSALDDPTPLHARLADRARAASARRRLPPAGTMVVVDNDVTPRATIVEVRTDDAPGVLYRVALLLNDAGLDIASARVETLGHEVVDTFYVRVANDGSKLTDPDAIARLRDAIVSGANPH